MIETVLETRNLVKTFGEVRAVNSVSFVVREGEIVGLLGPNGAGKTTLIALLLGLITPTSGSISLFGLELERNREAILEQVNFSSPYIALPLSLSVQENMNFFAKLYDVRGARSRIKELLALCGIQEMADRLTRDLSTGQMTCLNLAKALLNRPKILFLDEPTASLDPDMASRVRDLLKSLRDQAGCTVVCTSHNMKEMEEISGRILFMNRGEIIADGPPAEILELFKKKNLEEVFLEVARGKERE